MKAHATLKINTHEQQVLFTSFREKKERKKERKKSPKSKNTFDVSTTF